jgi:hypothetical protein
MNSTSESLSNTHSSGESEKRELYHEKDGISSVPEQTQPHDRAASDEDHSFEQDASISGIDYSDWNGTDDPDNPHNCTPC